MDPPWIADNLSKKILKISSRLNMLTLAYFASAPKRLPPRAIILSALKSFSQSSSSLLSNHAKPVKLQDKKIRQINLLVIYLLIDWWINYLDANLWIFQWSCSILVGTQANQKPHFV